MRERIFRSPQTLHSHFHEVPSPYTLASEDHSRLSLPADLPVVESQLIGLTLCLTTLTQHNALVTRVMSMLRHVSVVLNIF